MVVDTYRVRNWERFQHYKTGRGMPPWIKLHNEILSSKDWVVLADASKLLTIVCMLVASRHDGSIPADPEYFQRVAYLDSPPDFSPLIKTGFLIANDDSKTGGALADARPDQSREEKKREEAGAGGPDGPAPADVEETISDFKRRMGIKE